mgnify:CR=1 FL=1
MHSIFSCVFKWEAIADAFFCTVNAFAAAIDYQESYVYTDDENAEVDIDESTDICFDFSDDNATTTLYVWFVKDFLKKSCNFYNNARDLHAMWLQV